jgi:hypothetical protein
MSDIGATEVVGTIPALRAYRQIQVAAVGKAGSRAGLAGGNRACSNRGGNVPHRGDRLLKIERITARIPQGLLKHRIEIAAVNLHYRLPF